MSDAAFVYEGRVKLECQEGGFATATIALMDMDPTGRTVDLTATLKALGEEELGFPLADVLRARFARDRDDRADQECGRLRITIERVSE